jgi:PAS domain S-box-containing protein
MNSYDVAAMPGQSVSPRYVHKFRLALLAIAILFLSLIANQMYASYLAAQKHATTNAKNLALVLEAKLATDFEAAHSAVSAMAEEIGPQSMRRDKAGAYPPHITQRLKWRVRNIRSASALRYFDVDGHLLYSSVDSDSSFNVADRTFFQQLREDPAHPIIFSEVIVGRANHRVSMVVAKAICDKDGVFLGIATAAIDLKALHDDFSNIELGAEGMIVLRRLEHGALVVKFPGAVAVNNAPNPDIPLRRAILQGGPEGVIDFVSPVDGIQRIYGYRTVGSFPFFVAVGISKTAYLAEWRRNLVTTLLASTLFLAVLAAVFHRLARAESQRDRTALVQGRNEKRMRQIFRAVSEGLIFQNKDGIIVDVNPAAEQLLGLSRKELLGSPCMDRGWRTIREDHTPVQGHQQPGMVALRTGRPVRNQVLGIVASSRGLRWMSINSDPIFGPGKEAPDSVITIFSDVTERKQAETDLRIAATAFQSREGMMVTDNNEMILRVNRVFTEITGYTAEEVVGRTPRLLQSGRHDKYFYRKMWNSILGTGGWQGEIWDRRKNGDVRPMWVTISAVKDAAGAVTHFVGTHIDITERKNAETAMLNLNRDLSESRHRLRGLAAQNEARLEGERKHIAQEVHDELGQVLTALRMELSLLKMRFGALDPSVGDKVLEMKQLVDRAIQGVRNVAVNLRPPALDMGLVPAIEWLCGEFTRKTTIGCVFDAGERNINLDETRSVVIFRIVQESLTNVTRYARASQVVIHLGCRGSQLRLEVRDNGCGFDRAAAAKRKTFGLLGMRERALALGGRVDVISAPGKGTVIGVSIPIDADAAGESP